MHRSTAALAVFAGCLLAATLARADIVIGLAGPLTGEFASLGTGMRDGAAQAVADINAAGGVNGEMLTLESVDDGCAAKKADAVANQLAGKGAVMVVGHLCLKASIAGAAVYAAERIIQISPGTTFPGFTDNRAGPGIFRLCGRDDAEGAFAGTAIAGQFASGNVAVIDDRTAYGKAVADAAVVAMSAAGKQQALRDSYDPGAKDYTTLASRLEAGAIDTVYLGGSDPAAAIIARAIKARGMAAVLIGGSALLASDYADLAGDAAEGTLVTYPADPQKLPEAAAVIAELAAKKLDAAGYVLPAYAAVQVWAAAAKAAGSTNFDKVVAAISAGAFKTAIGDVAFDDKGDLRDPRYEWYVWHDGDYAPKGM